MRHRTPDLATIAQETRARTIEDFPQIAHVQFTTIEKLGKDSEGFLGAFYYGYYDRKKNRYNSSIDIVCQESYLRTSLQTIRAEYRTLLAELFSVTEEGITPSFLVRAVTLHELGHAVHFQEVFEQKGMVAGTQYLAEILHARKTLPVPKKLPHELAKTLLTPNNQPPSEEVRATIRAQYTAYMALPHEKIANDFSVKYMREYGYMQ